MRKPLVRILACVMAVVFPASLMMADTATAMMTPMGKVAVNGAPVLQATSLFPGDKIVTSANSTASITGKGLSLLVPGNSILVMNEKEVELDCGSALINVSSGMGARFSNIKLAPRDANARFEIRQEEGGFRVVARDGVLAVTNGSVPTLQPGQTMFAAAGCASDPTPSNDSQRGGGAPIPAAGTNVGAAVLLGVGVAGGLAAVVYFTTRTPSSPTAPQ